jgi:dihydrodipicolinate synthase/N-acetylneuraminate lyase
MRFKGIMVPLVTPLSGPDRLDREGLSALLEHVVAGEVNGVFIIGTTGEGPNLSYRLRHEMIRESARILRGRVPLFAAITDTSLVEAVSLARTAAESGCAAVAFAAPYYFPLDEEELHQYCLKVSAQLPLPGMLYNMPAMSKIGFPVEMVRRLMEEPRLVGIKDSGGDLDYYARLCAVGREREDWTTLIGPEAMLIESVRLGGDGGVNGGANVWPGLFTAAYAAAIEGDPRECAPLQEQIERFGAIYEAGCGSRRYVATTKHALKCLSLCDDQMTDAFPLLPIDCREAIRSVLEEMGLMPHGGLALQG